jgi:hypothetical protein
VSIVSRNFSTKRVLSSAITDHDHHSRRSRNAPETLLRSLDPDNLVILSVFTSAY